MGFTLRLPDDRWSAGWRPADPKAKGCDGIAIPLVVRNESIATDVSFFAADGASDPQTLARAFFAQPGIGHVLLYRNATPERAELEIERLGDGDIESTKIVFARGVAGNPKRVITVVGATTFAHEGEMKRSVDALVAAIEPLRPAQQ
ncbi:MAG TPA: hypothetical protein VLC10_03495 [Patescibacteria group bacterium]|nr:hypothetical protein [Patescibacteria group bacterium]